ncbi:MAG: response regulator transcription factor [Xanthomonadales bacterium]|nr:response regulator transcription factor [Xanthomonadales bacterium]
MSSTEASLSPEPSISDAAGSDRVVGLLEDDPDQARLFAHWLASSGLTCRSYGNGSDFRRRLGVESIDLLVLDWNLPDETGLEVLQWLRDSGHARLPVIFVTARNDEQDIVDALRAGADDYLTKPPRQAEMLARVAALMRRSGLHDETPVLEELSPYLIDVTRRRVELAGSEVELTDREFDLALFLFRRRGRVISREALLESVWKISGSVPTRTVDTHISRLRKKLMLNGENGWRLNAVYQHGYRLEQS